MPFAVMSCCFEQTGLKDKISQLSLSKYILLSIWCVWSEGPGNLRRATVINSHEHPPRACSVSGVQSLHVSAHTILAVTYEAIMLVIIPILQVRRPRHREMRKPAQRHRVRGGKARVQSQAVCLGGPTPEWLCLSLSSHSILDGTVNRLYYKNKEIEAQEN